MRTPDWPVARWRHWLHGLLSCSFTLLRCFFALSFFSPSYPLKSTSCVPVCYPFLVLTHNYSIYKIRAESFNSLQSCPFSNFSARDKCNEVQYPSSPRLFLLGHLQRLRKFATRSHIYTLTWAFRYHHEHPNPLRFVLFRIFQMSRRIYFKFKISVSKRK